MTDLKSHWNNIYKTKSKDEVGWTQEVPVTSLRFIHSFNLPKNASIIDIGAGESKLVDFLLNEGFVNITVLDISEEAIKKTQARLGARSSRIKWILSDITDFNPVEKYDLWHDRATFHFLTTSQQIDRYVQLAAKSINNNGLMVVGTFSMNGPSKCSGLSVKQYCEAELEESLTHHFKKIRCTTEDHITPSKTIQNFLFCSFMKAA